MLMAKKSMLIERIKQQSNVVPMFALGGLISKPTLGLLGENGPDNTLTPDAPSTARTITKSSISKAPNSLSPMNRQGAVNMMQGNNTSNISNSTVTIATKSPNSLSPMNRQGAVNMMQGNNTSNISNSNNSSESFSQYDKTLSTTTNVSKAVHQLETKTDKVIESIDKCK
jgi:hypothetical protein